MRKLITYFEEDEHRKKVFYENRLAELTADLARYQKSFRDTDGADPESPGQQAHLLSEKMKWVVMATEEAA